MADKGFELKVLIPTDDGFNISNKGIEKASYYLMYNISNRSYQFAGKIKTAELYVNAEFDFTVLKAEIEKAKIDKIICNKQFGMLLEYEVLFVQEREIGNILNNLIDIVDNKKEAN
jgi:hypothetical protein